METKMLFLPTKIDKRAGREDERSVWKQTDAIFQRFGKVTPYIPTRMDIKRYTTLGILKEQKDIVKDTFDFIINEIYNEKETNN